jgi:hypothetical protein
MQEVRPGRFEQIPTVWQNLFGAKLEGYDILAVFPLSALSEANEVDVPYDKPATMGVNAAGIQQL